MVVLGWIGASAAVVSDVLGRWLGSDDQLLLDTSLRADDVLLHLVFLGYDRALRAAVLDHVYVFVIAAHEVVD